MGWTPETTWINYSQLIGGAITAAIGGLIGFLSARRISNLNARQQAAAVLRASFAPQLAWLKSYKGSIEGTEEIRGKLFSDLYSTHAAELEKFRFFVTSKDVAAYEQACEKYEELLHPSFIIKVEEEVPSAFFIKQIRTLLNLTKLK